MAFLKCFYLILFQLFFIILFYFQQVCCDDGDPQIHKFEFAQNSTLYNEDPFINIVSSRPPSDLTDSVFAEDPDYGNTGIFMNESTIDPYNETATFTDTLNSTDLTLELDSSFDGSNSATSLPYELRIVATVVCVIILLLGFTGNVIVLLVVCRTRELYTNSTNVFLFNLSFADLLFLIVCMPSVLIELHSKPEAWRLGEFMCKTVPFVELVVAHGSILTILAISFERYYAICKPLKASYKCTSRRAIVTIFSLWTIACLATTPVFFITEHVSNVAHNDGTTVDVCITKADTTWQKLYFYGSMICFFWIPFIVLIIVYSIIARRLVKDDRRLLIASTHSSITSGGGSSLVNIRSSLACVSTTSGGSISKESSVWPVIIWRHGSGGGTGSRNGSASGPSSSRLNMSAEKAQMRSRRQVVFMLAAVVLCFFICLLPFRLFTLWTLLVPYEEIQNLTMERYYTWLYFCRIMLYVNSAGNPLLYGVVSSKFRAAFMETVCQYCCHCSDFCCCSSSDDFLDEFQKGMAPRGKIKRKYRRNRRFLMRQSTFNTTTTTTSSSLKNNSLQSSQAFNAVPNKNPQTTRFSSMDSILAHNNLRTKPPIRSFCKQHSFDLDIIPRSNGIVCQTSQSSKQSSIESATEPTAMLNPQFTPVSLTLPETHVDITPEPSIDALESNPIIAQYEERLNNISTYSAEYRRANMMKRSQRVAIIDEDDFENEYTQAQTDSTINSNEMISETVPDDPDEVVAIQIEPNIEEILSDPHYSTFESFV